MAARRIIYLLTLVGCTVFFWAYQRWFAWFALMAVLGLPLFSLLVSLPAMLTAKLELHVPEALTMGTSRQLKLSCRAFLPAPPWKCAIMVERPMTGQQWRLKNGSFLPTEHCGALYCTVRKVKICDYLGLFSFPLRAPERQTVLVRPAPNALKSIPQLERYLCRSLRPKRGGGFAENHELRLYRPGDSIHQIHWKLSAKTGKLILREPMEPERGRVLLRLDLQGTAAELDRKLGRLLWLGSHLLETKITYEIQCLSANGCECWAVTTPEELQSAVDAILCRKCATEGSIRDRAEAASWQYYIGGGTDEA